MRITGMLFAFVFATLPAAALDEWRGKCTRVVNGDTIMVERDGQEVKVQIYGIDCPEGGQAFTAGATRATAAAVLGKIIRIVPVNMDELGREVARIYYDDGLCLNQELLKAGAAWAKVKDRQSPEWAEWMALEATARENKVGLWAGKKQPVPPWQWHYEKTMKYRRDDAFWIEYVTKAVQEAEACR